MLMPSTQQLPSKGVKPLHTPFIKYDGKTMAHGEMYCVIWPFRKPKGQVILNFAFDLLFVFFFFNLFVSVTSSLMDHSSPWAHVTKSYGRLRVMCSVLEHQHSFLHINQFLFILCLYMFGIIVASDFTDDVSILETRRCLSILFFFYPNLFFT